MSMSIIDAHEAQLKAKRRLPTDSQKTESTITDVGELIAIIEKVCEQKKLAPEEAERVAGFRYRDHVERFGVKDTIGTVDVATFTSMVEAALRHHIKTITNSQSNGDWQVLDYDVDTRVDADGVRHLVMGVRWVDIDNQPDLKYNNGQPALSVTVENKTDIQSVLEAIKAQQTGDPELRELIKLLAAKVIADDKPKKGPRKADADDEPL